jgi:hypothetical protein
MIKLIDLLKGTIRNPLSGELYEGLTKTIESSIAVKILTNKLRDVPGFDIEDNEDNITLNFEPQYVPNNLGNYTSGNFHDKNIDKIFELTNNLGYFPAGFSSVSNTNVISNYNRYTASSFKKLLETQPTTIELIFEKKYDDEEKFSEGEFIYHITDKKYVDKIKSIGLVPKTKSKISTHPERIYFSIDKEDALDLWVRLKLYITKEQGILLTINPKGLDVKFYIDPNFRLKGVYTYGNIPPQNIIKYEEIDNTSTLI